MTAKEARLEREKELRRCGIIKRQRDYNIYLWAPYAIQFSYDLRIGKVMKGWDFRIEVKRKYISFDLRIPRMSIYVGINFKTLIYYKEARKDGGIIQEI